MATYTFEEYKKLREEHTKEFKCLEYIDSKDHAKALDVLLQRFKEHPNDKVLTLTRPVITMETFKQDTEFYLYLSNEVKLKSFGYWPEIGYFAFFRTDDEVIQFIEMNKYLKDGIIYNFKDVVIYENCAELTRNDDTKTTVWFDKVINDEAI